VVSGVDMRGALHRHGLGATAKKVQQTEGGEITNWKRYKHRMSFARPMPAIPRNRAAG
jgi:hypothetical protein